MMSVQFLQEVIDLNNGIPVEPGIPELPEDLQESEFENDSEIDTIKSESKNI